MKDWSDCKGQWAAMSSKARATHSSYPGKVTDLRLYSAPAKKLSHCHYRWQAFPWERLVRGTRAVWRRMGKLHIWSPAPRLSWWLPSSAALWGGPAIYSSDLRNGEVSYTVSCRGLCEMERESHSKEWTRLHKCFWRQLRSLLLLLWLLLLLLLLYWRCEWLAAGSLGLCPEPIL